MTHRLSVAPSRIAIIALAFVTSSISAQDTRNVKEPVIPPACVTLKASLSPASATSGEVEARAARAGSQNPALDTARIQQALDACERGHAVELAADGANSAFLTGPISLRAGVTLLIDKGVTLYATRNPEFYAIAPDACGLVNDETALGCHALITIKNATGAGIMGDGVIDGQGGSRLVVDGKPAAKSWWDLSEDARTVGHPQLPRMIDTDLSDDLTFYRVTLRNSPGLHLALHRSDGVTVWGVKIDTPKYARNTDGIDPAQSSNITITQTYIRSGDDNVAIKAADGPTTHITIAHNHFYWGHGMSIGSETTAGVSGIRVQDLSLDGTENGLRIKSSATHGGLVEDVLYDDICIRDSKVPVIFDSAYSFPGKSATELPVYQNITLRNIRISGGGKIQSNGFDSTHRVQLTLDGVVALDNPARYHAEANHSDLTFTANPVNLIFTGDDSTVTGKAAKGTLPGCNAKFVPFP